MNDYHSHSKKYRRRLWHRDSAGAKFLNGELPQKESWVYVRSVLADEAQSEFFASEFDTLTNDPRVAELVVSSSHVQLLTTPIIKRIPRILGSQLVYLGTYSIQIQLPFMWLPRTLLRTHPLKFTIICTDSGRHDGELKHKYSFVHMRDTGGFCFGARNDFIIEMANSGEFFTFFTMALEGLWQVNYEHYEMVLKDFRKVIRGKIEPAQGKRLLTHVGENIHG